MFYLLSSDIFPVTKANSKFIPPVAVLPISIRPDPYCQIVGNWYQFYFKTYACPLAPGLKPGGQCCAIADIPLHEVDFEFASIKKSVLYIIRIFI